MMWRLYSVFLFLVVTIQSTDGDLVDIKATIKLPDEDVLPLPLTAEEANPHFKILNEIDGKLYIGGKRTVVVYDPQKPIEDSKKIKFDDVKQDFLPCDDIINVNQRDKICQHYLRVAELVDEAGPTFLFCGTNSQNPYCYLWNVTTDGTIEMTANLSTSTKVQYSVLQNSTSRIYDGHLFTGFSEGDQPNPSHISKYRVDHEVNSYDITLVAETDDQNEKFVNEPDFVGKPYLDADEGFMYFFYRETAVEVVNQGKFVYSRVGRLCLNDNGHNSDRLVHTFFKARLNCSLQTDYPFYFSHIQDVIVEKIQEETYFHAVFTTTLDGPASSAVCSYRLQDIKKVFSVSKFKGKAPGKLPGPVDRPANDNVFTECNVNGMSAADRTFQSSNSLMDDLVPNYNFKVQRDTSHSPMFYSTEMNFYSIAVDSSNLTDRIYYVGTEHGTILKAYFKSNNKLETYQMELADKSPVTDLHYDNSTQTLLAVTEKGLYRIVLSNCSSGCTSECVDFHHGYCQEEVIGKCSLIRNPSMSTAYNTESVRILSLNNENIKTCANRKVELTCEVQQTSPMCDKVQLYWQFQKDGNTEVLVTCEDGQCEGKNSTIAPLLQYQVISNQEHYKLVHLSVHAFEETAGTFICSSTKEPGMLSSNATILLDDNLGCVTEGSYNERSMTRGKLEGEYEALTKCTGQVQSSSILFKSCNKCPGDPTVAP